MPRKLLKRILPNPDSIQANRLLRPIDRFLPQDGLWHIHQRNIAKSVFIGTFVAFLPLPGHTLIAAALAIILNANVIAAIAVSWIINNPLTMGFLFYLDYFVGAKIVGSHVPHVKFELSWDWLFSMLPSIGLELFIGAMVCGFSFGLLGYWMARLFWRWRIMTMWRRRKFDRQP